MALVPGGRRRDDGRDDGGRRPDGDAARTRPARAGDAADEGARGRRRRRRERAERGRRAWRAPDGRRAWRRAAHGTAGRSATAAPSAPSAAPATVPGDPAGDPAGARSSVAADARARPERPERPRRLPTVSTHRNAALAALRPEQIPVAEQLLRGGIPAVRNAIEEQNARARAEGRAEVSPEPAAHHGRGAAARA